MKYPDDKTYPHLTVNHVNLDKLPLFDEGLASDPAPMRAGDFFVSSGELLFRNYGSEGTGAKRTFNVEVEWPFRSNLLSWCGATAAAQSSAS